VTNLDGLAIRYLGNRVAAVSGKVAFEYSNPTGAFGLPPSPAPKMVTLTEVHAFRVCGGRITRQYSNVDALGFAAQVTTPN
jgi:hypothetical protein